MIDFEGYYLVPPDQVAYIETRRGGGDAQYGLFLGLSGGKELGVWYTEQRRREKPLIRSSHDRSRSENDRMRRISCIACG